MDDSGSQPPGDPPDRDARGRWARGHAPHPRAGRPRGQSVSAELRRLADPTAIAEALLAMVEGGMGAFSPRHRLEAIGMVLDRLEGRPASTLHVTAARAPRLPGNWDELSDEERATFLDRIAAGALGSGDVE